MTLPTRVQAERLMALALLAFSLAYLVLGWRIPVPDSSDDSPFSARSFPLVLGVLGTVLSLVLVLRPSSSAPVGVAGFAWGRTVGLLLLMAGFALLIPHLGFVVTAALFLGGGFRLLGERRLVVLLPVALGVSIGFWALFRALGVTLDWGVFERLLSH
jgi:putative tricarboxylic transport membrane protein